MSITTDIQKVDTPVTRRQVQMNMFQRANLSAAFFVFTFLVTGVAFSAAEFNNNPSITLFSFLKDNNSVVMLAIFIVLFRIKILLDDHRHFGEEVQDRLKTRFFGFILAVFSWIFWGLSALDIKHVRQSSEVLCYAVIISCLWIFCHLLEQDKDPPEQPFAKRFGWIGFNIAYIIILAALAELIQLPANRTILLVTLNIILIIDFWSSKSYEGVLG